MTVKHPIGQISEDAGQQQSKRHIAPGIRYPPNRLRGAGLRRPVLDNKEDQCEQGCEARNDDEERVIVLERTESRAGVGDVYQVEKILDHDDRPIGIDRMKDKVFRSAIKHVERQRDEENVFHLESTTASQRSHKSGCVLLFPTYSRCRQQRAHFA